MRRVVPALCWTLSAALGLALPAWAEEPQGWAYEPCLAAHDSLDGYVEAFEAAGWTRAQGEARDLALQGPSEMHYVLSLLPDPPETEEALDAFLGKTRDHGRSRFVDSEVLTRGEAAVVLDLHEAMSVPRLLCIVTAPDLPDADSYLAGASPGAFGDTTLVRMEPPPQPGTFDVWLDAVRVDWAAALPDPLSGTEGIVITLSLGEAP